MKIAFISKVFENYAFEIFSSILKDNGHKTELFFFPSLFDDFSVKSDLLSKFFNSEKYEYKKISDYSPDFIFLSIFTDNLLWSLNISEKLKKKFPKSKIILGGPHITVTGKELLEKYNFIDILVRGAGEQAIIDICNNSLSNTTPGIIYREKNEIISNDWYILPDRKFINISPDFELFRKKIPFLKQYHSTFSGFGCPYSCSFCIHSYLKKEKNYTFVKKEIDNLIHELEKAKRSGAKKIIFHDDVFTIDKKWLNDFLIIYRKKIALPYMCISHPELIDEEIARMLKKSNCVSIEIGTQTMNDKIRKKYLNRFESQEKIRNCLKILRKNRIPVITDHISGLPEEKIIDHIKALKIYKKYKVSRVILSYLTAYPEISINRYLLENNMISENSLELIRKGNVQNYMEYGSINTNTVIRKMEFLYEWLPYIPEFLLDFILKNELFKLLPENKFISKYIPFFMKTFSKNEFNLEIFIKRYIFYILKKVGL